MFPVSAFASSDTEYIRDGLNTGIWYSNPATKEALDSCIVQRSSLGGNSILIDLCGSRIDIYDDLGISVATVSTNGVHIV